MLGQIHNSQTTKIFSLQIFPFIYYMFARLIPWDPNLWLYNAVSQVLFSGIGHKLSFSFSLIFFILQLFFFILFLFILSRKIQDEGWRWLLHRKFINMKLHVEFCWWFVYEAVYVCIIVVGFGTKDSDKTLLNNKFYNFISTFFVAFQNLFHFF